MRRDGVPDFADVALCVYMENLLASDGGAVFASPGVDGVAAGGGGGDEIDVRVGPAVFVHSLVGLLAGVGLALAGKISAYKTGVDLLIHAAPGGALAKDILGHVW